MIENLRKYTGLIIVLFILVIVGFIFMDYENLNRGSTGAPLLKVKGRSYTDKEFQKLGSAGYQITQSFAQSGDYELLSFLFSITANATSQEQAEKNFFASRIILKDAQKQFGIYPGEEEIHSFIRKLKVFTGPNGEFSHEQYRNFIEKGIGRLGLTEDDLSGLASDILVHKELSKLLGGGFEVDRNMVNKEILIDSQKLAVEIAKLELKPFQEKMNPSEEEIKTYWETVQDAFKTEEKRRFRYFIMKPTYEPEPAALPELAKEANEEAKKAFEKAQAERSAKIQEARRKAQLVIGEQADDFLYQLEAEKGVSFEDLAKKKGLEIKDSGLISSAQAPEELKSILRASSTQGNAVDVLFQMRTTSDPLSFVSPAIAMGEDAWLIARLEEIEEVRNKTYEETKEEAKARFIQEKANETRKEAANTAAQKIRDFLKAGKSFAESVKEAGIAGDVVAISDISSAYQSDLQKAPSNLFEASKYTNPGELIAEPIHEADRSFIIRVVKREVEKKEGLAIQVDTAVERAKESKKFSAFSSWISDQLETAGIEDLRNQ